MSSDRVSSLRSFSTNRLVGAGAGVKIIGGVRFGTKVLCRATIGVMTVVDGGGARVIAGLIGVAACGGDTGCNGGPLVMLLTGKFAELGVCTARSTGGIEPCTLGDVEIMVVPADLTPGEEGGAATTSKGVAAG